MKKKRKKKKKIGFQKKKFLLNSKILPILGVHAKNHEYLWKNEDTRA